MTNANDSLPRSRPPQCGGSRIGTQSLPAHLHCPRRPAPRTRGPAEEASAAYVSREIRAKEKKTHTHTHEQTDEQTDEQTRQEEKAPKPPRMVGKGKGTFGVQRRRRGGG